MEYSGGYRNGYTHWYDENGNLLLIEDYVNDMLHGLCKEFNEKGEVVSKELYICGELIRRVEFKRR